MASAQGGTKADTKWFANRGQIIQIVLGAIACVLAAIKVWPEIKDAANGLSNISFPIPFLLIVVFINTAHTIKVVVAQNKDRQRFGRLIEYLERAKGSI